MCAYSVCVHACVCVCVCVCVRACMCAWHNGSGCAYMYQPSGLPHWMHRACGPVYVYTYIHTYVYVFAAMSTECPLLMRKCIVS